MSKRQIEYKQLPFYVQKYDDDQGLVDAIVAVMGNMDQQKDIIENGSFTKTITERGHKVKVLDNHSAQSVRDVVGKINVLREVGRNELPESLLTKYPNATGGLFASIQFLIDTPEGVGIFKRIKAKVVDQYSIGYDALDYTYENMDVDNQKVNVRRLKTIRLWEISPVVFAANEGTMTVAAKAFEGKPWNVFPVGGEHCVFRVDVEGDRMGESLGCHDTTEAARQQVEALYAGEQAGQKDVSDEEKAINLSRQIENVRQAFHAQYNPPNDSWSHWVNTVYDEYLIVTYAGDAGEQFYQVNYQEEDDSFTFAARGEWIEGEYEFIPINRGKADSVFFELADVIIEQVEKERKRFAEALYCVETFDYKRVYSEYAEEIGKSELTEADKKQAILNAVLNQQAGPPPDETPTSTEAGSEDKATPTDELLKLIEIEKEQLKLLEV